MSRPPRVSPPPANNQQARPSMPARPMEELTTQIVPLLGSSPSFPRPRRRRGPLAFMRTLRWRLTLTYTALFAVLLVVLGLVLNGIIGRVLYAEDLQSFRTDMVATVGINHGRFDLAVTGAQTTCAGAMSYQQAFQDTVATPLSSHTGVSAVYLLDRLGNVLAPETGAVTPGNPGPYLQTATFTAVRRSALQPGATATSGVLDSGAYQMTDAAGQRVGVVLVAIRYHTASPCVNKRNGAVGIVEVVTDFSRVQHLMDTVHLVLALSILAAVVVGALIAGPLTAQALRPLTRMTRTAQRIASGDLSQRVRLPHGGDEIGRLADTFDEMIARIEAAFSAQQASEERMRQFIADASHELRTPLTSIRGYTDVLLRGAKDDPETAQQVLLATRREAERMSRLVGDLLTLARLDTGRPLDLQPVDVIALTGEAVDQARILAGEREVSLRSDGLGRLPVLADRDRLKQVLLVLLDNALKYGRPAPEGWVRVQVWREDGAAFVSVADNGPGIAPQDLPHIFDRFYRAERGTARRTPDSGPAALAQSRPTGDGDGTSDVPKPNEQRDGAGLGLAIAQAIVRAHGGTLSVRSEPGLGATFTVSLPIALVPAVGPGPRETHI